MPGGSYHYIVGQWGYSLLLLRVFRLEMQGEVLSALSECEPRPSWGF